MLTTQILTALAVIEYNMSTKMIAQQVFPNEPHMEHKGAEYNNRLLAFYGYLDKSRKQQFVTWVNEWIEKNPKEIN